MLMSQARAPLADITNYTPTIAKTAAGAPAWKVVVPVPENKNRKLECIKAEQFEGRIDDVARYIADEASAGRIWNFYRSEESLKNKNRARQAKNKAEARECS